MHAPEIQQMYSLNMPVSNIRTKVRQEFERHRYVNKLPVVDMLIMQNDAEFQVRYIVYNGQVSKQESTVFNKG
ncbi:hypothetical protein OEA41_008832 [Lepraria neglecta]|uniref:Uncharacterized protein n=1 Tax=Lepraria neglecta TaxID=209136 RepID=A0AAE0DH92_9LECA|nr:hypothetical protein OEA41_008832 [Lepraria neglecta]